MEKEAHELPHWHKMELGKAKVAPMSQSEFQLKLVWPLGAELRQRPWPAFLVRVCVRVSSNSSLGNEHSRARLKRLELEQVAERAD